MYPIYKFELTANGTTQQAFPIYGEDLAKDFNRESGQQFFRAKLTGNLTFENADYTFITAQAFDAEFGLEIFISYDAGQTWESYWTGAFWKTDCEFDLDAQTVKVNPAVSDRYTAVLAGLDKEYNLIELAPEILPVKADKRPMLQIYVPGETTVGCFLSGIWWEQECEAITDLSALTNTYHFGLKDDYRIIEISGNTFPPLPAALIDSAPTTANYSITNGNYQFTYAISSYGSNQYQEIYSLYVQNTLCWQATLITNNPTTMPATVYLSPVGSASGNVQLRLRDFSVYGRLVMDVASWGGVDFPRIPDNDIVENNRNYHYVSDYYQYDVVLSAELWPTPTEWGMYEPGKYYQVPDLQHEYFPVGRSAWAATSLWIRSWNWTYESEYRKPFVLKDSYPIHSVISVLLGEIDPDVTHEGTTAYSQFLYGTNFLGVAQTICITPKSNVISSGYDQPAQKVPITLREVLEMLRDCFRCFWFIDDQNRFRIEHIQYFRKGGSYTGTPVVGTDLTVQKVTRNGKAWAFARDQYKYDKPEMAARYQFGWMDDVTQLFEGYPIEILSKYVNPDNIEQITVNKFTSDIDFVLLNPATISKDGFVLLAAIHQVGGEQVVYDLNSYTLRDYNIVQATGKYGTTATYKHIIIPVTPGRTIRVVSSAVSGTDARIAWFTSDAAPVAGGDPPFVPGTSLIIQAQNTTVDYTVPAGASYMFVYFSSSPYNYKPQSVTMLAQGEEYYLPYYNFATDLADHNVQNGYVAFAYLQQYYAYDLPAWDYKINGETKTAYGVKRLKHQTLNFPALYDPDLVELIKTNLGNGEINKLSLNLSSRGAQATLNFDIEGGGAPQSGYRVEFGDNSHTFPANGGSSYTLAVYGVTYENGIEVSRESLSISDVSIVKSGDAPITRNNLTFSASTLGATATPAKTANWTVTWTEKNVSAVFVTTQQANTKNITGQTTTYTPEMDENELTWENSETDVASGNADYMQFSTGVRVIVTQTYTYTSGVSGTEIASNVLDKETAVLTVVSGTGLTVTEQGSGVTRYYRVDWAQNNTGSSRVGMLRLTYDSGHYWDYNVTQAARTQVITYALEIDPVNYTFELTGGSLNLQVEGVTRTDGVVTSRETLTASELTFTSSGDNVATRSGKVFTAADISQLSQAATTQYWNIVWNAHPSATANLSLSQPANVVGYPQWIETSLGTGTYFYISDIDTEQGWIEYTGPDVVYIAIDNTDVYVGNDVFDDSAMTQGDVVGTVTDIGPIAPILPQGYTALSYVGVAPGTQAYINTGINTGNNLDFEIIATTFDSIGSTDYGCLFGARQGSNSSDYQLTTFASGTNAGTLRLGGSSQNYNAHLSVGVEFSAKLIGNTYTINGNSYTVSRYISTAKPIYLFALNNNGSVTQHGHSQVKRFKLSTGATKKVNYFPCKNPNNVIGFYDLVAKQFVPPTSGTLIGG